MKIQSILPVVAIALAMPSGSRAQTQLDLRTQSKSVDFSNALSTRPFTTGVTLPTTCVVGEAFFKTDAAAGQNWFGCSSTNQWSRQSGGRSLNGYTVATYSSTPAFTASGNHATTFLLLLSGDVNSSSLSGGSAGDLFTFRICQDSTGNYSFVWPSKVKGAAPINPTANACTSQTFVFDGASAQAISDATVTGLLGSAITMPGSTSGITTVQPSAVAGGTLTLPARTATVATTVGASSANNCAKFDSSGNLVDAGAACGSGSSGGSGTIFSNTGVGNWWPFGIPHAAGATGLNNAMSPNKVIYREFSVPASMTVRSMSWFQVTDDAGKHYTWGIYDAGQALVTNGQCSTATSVANSVNSCTFAGNVNLSTGTYYLAFSTDEDGTAGNMTFYCTQDGYIGSRILGGAVIPRTFTGSTSSTGTTTIALPAAFASDTRSARAYEEMPHAVFLP